MPDVIPSSTCTIPARGVAAPVPVLAEPTAPLASEIVGEIRPQTPPRMLRIVHVIETVDPHAGGPATVISRLAAAQAAQGHQVTIVSRLGMGRREAFEKAVAGIPGFSRVKLDLPAARVSLQRLLAPEVTRRLEGHIEGADVVHLHGVWDMILLAAARVAQKARVPYVVRPCGMLDPWSLAQHAWKKKLALRLMFRRMLQNAAAIHVLNDQEAKLIEPLALSAPRWIIPNGVFFEEIEGGLLADGEAFPRQFPALQQRRYILFLSRLHHKKGLDLLAAAFANVAAGDADVQLVVAGADDGAAVDFNRRIASAGLRARVHLVGALSGAAKYSAYRHAACFCLPSRQEGFSVAVTEALACGTPVAISRATHFPEAAEAGAGVEFDLDVDQIAGALRGLLAKTPEERQAMGQAGQELVRGSFTWPRIAEMTSSLYGNLESGGTMGNEGHLRGVKKVVIPALRAAGVALAWVLVDRNINT